MSENVNHPHHWSRINSCEKHNFKSGTDRLVYFGKVLLFLLTIGVAYPTILCD